MTPTVVLLAVDQPLELADDLGLEPARLVAGLDDPLRLASLDVDEHAGEAEAVGARARPVDVAQQVGGPGGARLEREVAVVEQPAVEVDAAAKRREAVVGDHAQHVAGSHPLEHLAHQRVVVDVELLDRGAVRRVGRADRSAG